MKNFVLFRREDETGISGTGVVAEGSMFTDGTCVVRWLTEFTSTAIYNGLSDLESIHGHHGKTAILFDNAVMQRASHDAMQDACENCQFASIGGPNAGMLNVDEKRAVMMAPDYIADGDAENYIAGYQWACARMYGIDWRTAPFGWGPALTIDPGVGR